MSPGPAAVFDAGDLGKITRFMPGPATSIRDRATGPCAGRAYAGTREGQGGSAEPGKGESVAVWGLGEAQNCRGKGFAAEDVETEQGRRGCSGNGLGGWGRVNREWVGGFGNFLALTGFDS